MQTSTHSVNTFDGISTIVEPQRQRTFPIGKISRNAKLIISLVFFVLVSIALLIALILQICLPKRVELFICHTRECTLASSLFLNAMDKQQDPCKDFYNFVCGQYIRRNSKFDSNENMFEESRYHLNLQLRDLIQQNNSINDSEAVKKLRKAYQVCMNTTHTTQLGIAPLAKFLELLGGWPLALGKTWKPANGTRVEDLLAKMEIMGFPSYLIAVGISPDPTNNSIYRIQFDQPDKRYKQLRRRKIETDQNPIEAIILAIVESLGNNDSMIILNDLADIIKLHRDLQSIFTPEVNRSNHTRMYNKMTIRQLQNLTDSNLINWHVFLQLIFNGITEINEDEEIIVCEVDFMKKLPNIIAKHGQRTITNYALWNAVEELIEYITPELYLTTSPLRPYLNINFNKMRWNLCLSATNEMLPYAMWRLLVDNYIDEPSINAAEDIVETLRKAYGRTIALSHWLDVSTKKSAIKKVFRKCLVAYL